MTFVLHPSVSLAWCFESEHTPALLALLDRTAHAGATAPLLLPLDKAHAPLAAATTALALTPLPTPL